MVGTTRYGRAFDLPLISAARSRVAHDTWAHPSTMGGRKCGWLLLPTAPALPCLPAPHEGRRRAVLVCQGIRGSDLVTINF